MNKGHLISILSIVVICVSFLIIVPAIGSENNTNANDKVARVNGQEYDSLAEAVDAATEGQTVEIIKAYDSSNPDIFKLPGSHLTKVNITKDSSLDKKEAVINCDFEGNICWFPDTTTFEDVNIIFSTDTTYSYHGFQESPNIIFNDCILQGLFFGYGDCTFNNCNFVQNKAEYNMWTYQGNHTYTNCTFESYGKFINVYNSGMGVTFTHKFDGCKFINKGAANKSAINVKANCDDGYGTIIKLMWDVQINNCTYEGNFTTNNRLQDELVMIDDYNSEFVIITKNGKQLYPELPKNVDVPLGSEKKISTSLAEEGQLVNWKSTNENIIQLISNNNAENSIIAKRIAAGSACVIASVPSLESMKSYFYFGAPKVEFNMCGHGSQVETQVLDPETNPEMHPVRPEEDPTAEGYEFDGWFSDSTYTKEYDFNAQVFSDTIIYAKWTGSGPIPPTPPTPPTPPSPEPEITPTQAQVYIDSVNTGDPNTTSIICIMALLLSATSGLIIFSKKERKALFAF